MSFQKKCLIILLPLQDQRFATRVRTARGTDNTRCIFSIGVALQPQKAETLQHLRSNVPSGVDF